MSPSATEIAARVRAGQVPANVEVDACLARIAASQAILNTHVTLTADDARDQPKTTTGALAGVPFSVKDNLDTAGVRTTFGSRTMSHNVPTRDAVAVRRMRDAGGVLVGKTTLPEFASSILSHSPLTGSTKNPWNLEMSPGGSSSGAAAAVAAGLEPIALTTDAGASTRLPAAACGVLGLKPSIGLVPYESFPDGFGNFIHIGLITRTAADMAAALDVISGEDASDPLTIGVPATHALTALQTPLALQGVRIAWRPLLGNAALDSELRALCEAALAQFAAQGASLTQVDEPFENAGATWRVLQQANFAGRFKLPDEETAKTMDSGFVASARAAMNLSARELTAALYKRTDYFRIVQSWFARFDWVATPVTTTAAIPLSARGDSPLTNRGQGPWARFVPPGRLILISSI